ncbi:MAG: universal stress protein, partial [Nitrosopumilaceae archaeon]
MTFKKILVPYDNSINSKHALNKAFELASIAGSTVIIVNVISYHNAVAKIIEPYKETMLGHVKKFLDEAKKDAVKKNIKTEGKISYGNPAEEIMNLMKKK